MSLNKVIKSGSHISNRTSAALVKHLDGGSFSSDELSNSSFLLAAQLLKPSFNFLQCRSVRRSFSLLLANRPLVVRAHVEAVWRSIFFTWSTNMGIPFRRFLLVFRSVHDSKDGKIHKWSAPISFICVPRSMVVTMT